jgi:ketopantoate reductase
MVQDLLAGRPMESDQIFGDVVRRAEYVGITVPRIALVRDLIAGLNRTTSHR